MRTFLQKILEKLLGTPWFCRIFSEQSSSFMVNNLDFVERFSFFPEIIRTCSTYAFFTSKIFRKVLQEFFWNFSTQDILNSERFLKLHVWNFSQNLFHCNTEMISSFGNFSTIFFQSLTNKAIKFFSYCSVENRAIFFAFRNSNRP